MDKIILNQKSGRGYNTKACRREPLVDLLVAEFVCSELKISMDDLRAETRCNINISKARMSYMYLLHTVCRYTLTDAGKFVGRDRTTARHACATIEELRDTDIDFDGILDNITSKIHESVEI